MCLRNLLILLFLNFFIVSCGYHFFRRPAYFKSEWKTIYIAPWKNFTSEVTLGELITYELRKKFAQGKFLIPVYDESKADLILKGEIKKVYLEPISYQTFLQTKERKVSFEGEYQLIDRKEGKIILEGHLSRYEIYRVPVEATNVMDPGRSEALELLAKDLAEIILQEVMFKNMEKKYYQNLKPSKVSLMSFGSRYLNPSLSAIFKTPLSAESTIASSSRDKRINSRSSLLSTIPSLNTSL